MITINIAAAYGPLCISTEDGELLRERIAAAFASGETVELDFQEIDVLASPFLNAGIGSLLRDFKPAELNKRLVLHNLSPEHDDLIRRVIANAREYFTNPKVRQIVDAINEKSPSRS